MKKIIDRYKLDISFILLIIITSIIFTALQYISDNYKFLAYFEFFLSILYVFIYSYIKSFKSSLKGYKIGLKTGLKMILIYSVINIIFLNRFCFRMIMYYLLVIIISISSSILEKNKRKN